MSSFVITQFSDTASVEKEKQARPTPDAVDGYHHLVRANDQLMQKLQQMEKSEFRYKSLVEEAAEGIFITDFQLVQFKYINTALCRMLGYSKEELMQLDVQDIFPEDTWRQIPVELEPSGRRDNTSAFDVPCLRKDGTSFHANFCFTEVVIDGSSCCLCFLTDVTELKRVEDNLKKSEENFRRSLDDSPLGARIVTEKGETLYANRKLLEIYGYDNLEELQAAPTKLRYTPESYTEFLERRSKRRRGESVPSEYRVTILNKRGEPRRLQVFRKEILWNGERQYQVLYNDITEREKAKEQKKALEEKLQRSEKMEFLGQLAGRVAHDLNNVLGALSGYSELLLMEVKENQKARHYAENIMHSAKKGALIIQDLLTLTRRGITATEVVSLNHVATEFFKSPVLDRIRHQHPCVEIIGDLNRNLLYIKGSPVHLEKMLMNLVLNAAESISGRGRVVVRTENRHVEDKISGFGEIGKGDYVVLSVSDTGMGIPDEYKEKIFEPFFTRKTSDRSGTGLGLPIVLGTVTDHNGCIEVQSKTGEGTTFTVYFPVTRDEMISPRCNEVLERYLGRGESVLVVDDITEQREVAAALLEKLGYRVDSVPSGEAALEYLKTSNADVLLLDMIMRPGMDGLETYQKVLEITNRQKAVIVSGFSETERVRTAQKLGAGAYIKKPYTLETIGMAIRKVLDIC